MQRMLTATLSGLLLHAAHAAPLSPQNLRVPPQAFDESSITVVWDSPVDGVTVDHRIYLNGKAVGEVSKQASTVKTYFEHFAAADTEGFHVRPAIHHYSLSRLKPASVYKITVRALNAQGEESADSDPLFHKTAPKPKLINITRFGAKGDGKTLNTHAIQKAINAAPAGAKVLIPEGIFKSGALFLKSNMTLEIRGTLLGSENAADYPPAYRLYPYSTFERPASLINAIAPHHLENIRITGTGIVDGNGWQHENPAQQRDESGRELPQYIAGNRDSVLEEGILARNQVKEALDAGDPLPVAYSQKRSSLITLREARNVHVSGLTLRNPAFHGLMFLESENISVHGLDIQTWDVNNADGIEFGNSRNVFAFDNFLDTGDDCINFAAGTGALAATQAPARSAWIFNNYFRRGHGAIVLGSHTGAWIEDILAENNVIFGADVALRAKSTTFMGGGARRVIFRDNAAQALTRNAVILTLDYVDNNAVIDYPPASQSGQFRDFTIENLSVADVTSQAAIRIQGSAKAGMRHQNIVFSKVRFKNARAPRINGLHNGIFEDVEFFAPLGAAEMSDSENLLFSGKTAPHFQW